MVGKNVTSLLGGDIVFCRFRGVFFLPIDEGKIDSGQHVHTAL